jgi:hypothetical protein
MVNLAAWTVYECGHKRCNQFDNLEHMRQELRYGGITLALNSRTFEMRVEQTCEDCTYLDHPTRFDRTRYEDRVSRDIRRAGESPLKNLVTQLCPHLNSPVANAVILKRVKSQMQLEGLSDDEDSLDGDTKARVTSVIREQVDQYCQVGEALYVNKRVRLVPKLVYCGPGRGSPKETSWGN